MGTFLVVALLVLQTAPATDIAPQAPSPATATGAEASEPKQNPTEVPPQQIPEEVLKPAETKQLPSTGRKIITNFGTDQKEIWTSPFRMDRKDAKWWALFGGGTAVLIATDHRTSKALPNTIRQVSFSRNVSQIGAVYTTLPVAGGLYLYGRAADDPHAREAGALGTEALMDAFVVSSILKYAFGRERPDYPGGNGRFFKGQRSFPSGHATMSWAFASLISHEYKGGKVVPTIAYSLAATVSVARFTAQQHFASDIVAGGAMGWFIGKFVFERHLDPAIHKRYSTAENKYIPEVNPVFAPGSHTYALALDWHPGRE
jgi:membrane-associated phospholipid phosphatase